MKHWLVVKKTVWTDISSENEEILPLNNLLVKNKELILSVLIKLINCMILFLEIKQ